MKKIKIFAFVLGLVMMSSFASNAQKIGYVNVEGIVSALPEIPKIQAALQKYSEDSIGAQFQALSAEYNRKDSIIKDPKTVKSLKETAQRDLNDIAATLQNWQNIGSQMSQAKQAELLGPLYNKVMDAVRAVAKEKGYAYVLTREAFIVAPDGDNLDLTVAQKLGIKVNPQASGAAPAAGTTTPAKPKN